MNIIIGATSGIGKALFEKYATDGNRIGIVVQRNVIDGHQRTILHRAVTRYVGFQPA